MAEYRDEKETLRRRVAALEAQLSEQGAIDRRDAETNEALRKERDSLRRSLDAARRERDANALTITQLSASGESDVARAALRRSLVPVVASVACGALLLGVVLSLFGAPDVVSAFVFGALALAAVSLVALVMPGWRRRQAEDAAERVRRAELAKTRRAKKKRRAARVRVEAQREDVSVKASQRQRRRRKKRR